MRQKKMRTEPNASRKRIDFSKSDPKNWLTESDICTQKYKNGNKVSC